MNAAADALSIVASLFSLAGPPAALFATFGYLPRLGPGRAVGLALHSRLLSRAAPASLRTADVLALRRMLASARSDQYVVVVGPKGVGKTVVTATATEAMCGVVHVDVPPGTPGKEILADAFAALTRCSLRFVDLGSSARRVLWWHALLFRTPATVVLHAGERKPAQAFADVDNAARVLADTYGVRVIIDASDNSLPPAARATLREKVLDLGPMPRAMLESLPELAQLVAALKVAHAADVVWAAVDGAPAAYRKLEGLWEDAGRGDVGPVADAFVASLLDTAIVNVDDAIAGDARLRELFALFLSGAPVRSAALRALDIARQAPDKVLRTASGGPLGPHGAPSRMLVPANAATALVLRFGLKEAASIAALRTLLGHDAAAGHATAA
jgi:hypothetical protein